jgi:hypothetical protein
MPVEFRRQLTLCTQESTASLGQSSNFFSLSSYLTGFVNISHDQIISESGKKKENIISIIFNNSNQMTSKFQSQKSQNKSHIYRANNACHQQEKLNRMKLKMSAGKSA